MSVLISCEVGGDHVPAELISAFEARSIDLPVLRNIDTTAKYLAKRISDRICAPMVFNEVALDLIDTTKSLHHRQLFGEVGRGWPAEIRQWLIDEVHSPYRERVRAAINQMFLHYSYVLHLTVRTFKPKSNGEHRRADAGLLYDPARQDEVDLCLDWIDEMYELIPMLRVRRNYPRRGTTDSLTKAMRGEFAERNYIGVELLVNRAWCQRPLPIREEVVDGMCETLISLTRETQSDAA